MTVGEFSSDVKSVVTDGNKVDKRPELTKSELSKLWIAKDVSETSENPLYNEDLEKYIEKPYINRASLAVTKEHPHGSSDATVNKNRTVLQQHCDFWDPEHTGMITMFQTYQGLRDLGYSLVMCIIGVIVINPFMSLATFPGLIPDWQLRIFLDKIHRGKHGSDSNTYDPEGRFSIVHFESIFTKYDADQKGGLNKQDIMRMIYQHRQAFDIMGFFAETFEWGFLYILCANDEGVLTKENIRRCMDGTLFHRIKADRVAKMKSQQHHASIPSSSSLPSTTVPVSIETVKKAF